MTGAENPATSGGGGDSPACTCWTVADADGAEHRLGRIDLHEHVQLVTRDGVTVRGQSMGVTCAHDRRGSSAKYEVALEDSSVFVEYRRDEISTITPTRGFDEIHELLQTVREALNNPDLLATADEPARLRLVVSDHEAVDVELSFVQGSCSPRDDDSADTSIRASAESLGLNSVDRGASR